MHWFWRAMIGVLGACCYVFVLNFIPSLRHLLVLARDGIQGPLPREDASEAFARAIVDGLVPAMISLTVYGLLTCFCRGVRRQNDDSLCRNCGYNLRGNVSGICPECGCAAMSPGGQTGPGPGG